jgi:plastocyanin
MNALARNAALGTMLAALLLSGACASNEPAEQRQVSMSVDASSGEVMAGDTVTLRAKTENALGRDSHVAWTSVGGDIKTEENGRTARASFKKPGLYTVTARLYVNDRVMREESVDIRVKPVN